MAEFIRKREIFQSNPQVLGTNYNRFYGCIFVIKQKLHVSSQLILELCVSYINERLDIEEILTIFIQKPIDQKTQL